MRRSTRTVAVAFFLLCALPTPAAPGPSDEQVLKDAGVATDGASLLDYVRKRTVADVDADKIKTLIGDLGDDDFDVREKASAALVELRGRALPFLKQAARSDDVEVMRRAEDCLRRIGTGFGTSLDAAAVRMLAVRKPAGASEVLLNYLPVASAQPVADEVEDALASLARADGRTDRFLLTALEDKSPLKRAAAGVALTRGRAPDGRDAIRKLLRDSDTSVRFRVGMALAAARDKEAVPVLIEGLTTLPLTNAWEVEELLHRVAGAQAPAAALTLDATGRKRCRDAWAGWWAKNEGKADLSRIQPPVLGYTLLLLLDDGVAREVDADGKTRWEIKGLEFPLDAQLLGDEHLIAAEYKAMRVTERDRKGTALWSKALTDGPLAAQRLPNGNTFIVTSTQLLEVDKGGKEVWTHTPRNGETFRKATKLANGDLACVTSANRFVRMTPAGKELVSFPVEISTNGGRIDVTPNGHVMVPQMSGNKVIEYDTTGKPVWEVSVDEPVAVVRLPNGHTLVTTLNQKRALEFDRTGRQVWEYKSDTRVTRAFRR